MLVSDLISLIDRLAAFGLAEPWDHVGLQVGSPTAEVSSVLVALDVAEAALDQAARDGCQAIVAHHPLLFEPLESVTDEGHPGGVVMRAVREGRAIVAAHTNLDKADGGLAEIVGAGLGLEALVPVAPTAVDWCKLVGFVPEDDAEAVRRAIFAAGAGVIGNYVHCSFSLAGEGSFLALEGATPTLGQVGRDQRAEELRIEAVFPRARRREVLDAFVSVHPYEEPAFDVYPVEDELRSLGLGRVGRLPDPQPLDEFARAVGDLFGMTSIRFSGDPGRVVTRVACVPGSGASTIAAAASVADVLVTGDVKYHDADRAARLGLALVDVPHDICESWALARWTQRLADALAPAGAEVRFHERGRRLWRRQTLDRPPAAAPAGASASGPVSAARTPPAAGRPGSRDDALVHLYVDGGARGNPGPAAIGGQILSPGGDVLEEFCDRIGEATNNVAEYQALITGLELALDRGLTRLCVFSDSELIVRQVNGTYKVKDATLKGLNERVRSLLTTFAAVEVRHVPREQNAAADRLVNEALDADR